MRIKYNWHMFNYYYNKMLHDSCLDVDVKTKLMKRATYHEQKAARNQPSFESA